MPTFGLLSPLRKETPSEPGFILMSVLPGNDYSSDLAVTSSLQVPGISGSSCPFSTGQSLEVQHCGQPDCVGSNPSSSIY